MKSGRCYSIKVSINVFTSVKRMERGNALQNRAARIICTNFDIINYRGIDLVRELQWLSISQRINYFLCVLVFNCIHGNAPRYLSDSIDMASHMHDINTRLNMPSDVNVPLGKIHYMRSSFIYIEVQWPGMRFQMLLKTPGHCLLSE